MQFIVALKDLRRLSLTLRKEEGLPGPCRATAPLEKKGKSAGLEMTIFRGSGRCLASAGCFQHRG
jgi:hypothetical protein